MEDIREFLRSMYGIGNRRPPNGFPRPREDEIDLDEEGDEVPWEGDTMFGGLFSHLSRDIEQMHRQMEEMFQHFDVEFPPDASDLRNPELPANPRDDMLKEPDSNPNVSPDGQDSPSHEFHGVIPGFHHPPSFFGEFFSRPNPRMVEPSEKKDKELDGIDDKEEIARLFNPNSTPPRSHGNPMMPHSRSFSSGRSVSVSTSVGPNGQLEERKTVRDSSGEEEVTVTRKLGNQSYSTTTKIDRNGVQEKVENFTNMDEKDVSDFNERWSNNNSRPRDGLSGPVRPDAMLKSPHIPHDSDKDTKFTSLLKNMFDWLKPKD